jgi:3-deoxy-D-manno-octulosonic-acid transferase
MILIYRLFYALLKFLVLVLQPFLSANLKRWVQLRGLTFENKAGLTQVIWFHASSGEIEYCKSVIREIKLKNPQQKIVVSYSSGSAEKLFSNIRDYVDLFFPLPWDQPMRLLPLLESLKPVSLIFSRTDLWPELIHQVHEKKIPIAVISFNPNLDGFSGFVLSKLLKKFNYISCVDEKISMSVASLAPQALIKYEGDTRFDQVFFRLSQATKLSFKCDSPLLVMGSTWPEDETVIVPSLNNLKTQGFKFIISPHEVAASNIERLEGLLMGLSFQKLSTSLNTQTGFIDFNTDILIIDQIGFLADCYRFANVAFVGGSFKQKVHSVMEPLCCGLHVLHGPHYKNNPEAVRYQNQYAHVFSKTEEFEKLALQLKMASKNDVLFDMKKNLMASKKVAEKILSLTAQ